MHDRNDVAVLASPLYHRERAPVVMTLKLILARGVLLNVSATRIGCIGCWRIEAWRLPRLLFVLLEVQLTVGRGSFILCAVGRIVLSAANGKFIRSYGRDFGRIVTFSGIELRGNGGRNENSK